MSVQKKLSVGTAHLLAQLQASVKETVGEEPLPGDLEITLDKPKLANALTDYRTVTDSGERGVSIDDLQAVGNFRRDLQNATRMFAGDNGVTHMETNAEADSFRFTVNNEELGLSVQAAFYRPGREEQGNTNFVSITDQWEGSDEDKAIEAHLKGLTKQLAGTKK
jgi:hypothetical protein